jgi:MFS transporter, ACS family, hexuronate transporter
VSDRNTDHFYLNCFSNLQRAVEYLLNTSKQKIIRKNISMTENEKGKVKIGSYRWMICALLFFGTTINYIDRQVLGILAPLLQSEINWTESEYGWIVTAFQATYAIGLILFGWFIDKYGSKIGYSISVTVWSIAAMAHALAKTPFGFGAARAGLGLGEGGNFPAAIKTIAEWFPQKERALAIGIFNSGTNIGAIITPAVVPWLTVTYGWQAAFIATGSIGFLWLIGWVLMYERPEKKKRLASTELKYILSDKQEISTEKIPWSKLLKYRQTWVYIVGKFFTDPIWWFYLFWLPKFLNKSYGLTLTELGLPLITIYLMISVGSVGGGWLSSLLIERGMAVMKSRELVMCLCGVCVLPIVFASQMSNLWIAVLLIGLAAAAHQGYGANLMALISDLLPKRVVGSVTSLGGLAGSISGVLFSIFIGYILEWTGSYILPFLIAAPTYLVALGTIHLLASKAKPVD